MRYSIPQSLIWASWVVIVWGLREASPFLVPVLLAGLLAFVISPVVNFLESKKVPEWVAILASALLLFLPVFAAAGLMVHEATVLVRNFPAIMQALKSLLSQLNQSSFAQFFNLTPSLDIESLTVFLSEDSGKIFTTLFEGFKMVASGGAEFILVLLFSILILMVRKNFKKAAHALFPDAEVLEQMITLVKKFLFTRMAIAVWVTVTDAIILKGCGSQYVSLFSVLLGASTFVPAVGFFIAAAPPMITGLAAGVESGSLLVLYGLLYLVSSIEGHFLTPKFLGRSLNLNLLFTFLGLFAGHLLWGIGGMLVAIPILGMIRVLLNASPRHRVWALLMADL